MNELRQAAIRLLARREFSRAEIARRLSALGTSEEIDQVLSELQASGLQSDTRFAGAWLRGHAARHGLSRLRQDLRQRGIAESDIDAELAGAGLPPELERARDIWSRKFGTPPADAREWARQARFLQSRGFSTDVIRRLLREFTA
ncbi:MAG TPA: regulatory protein RecX [Rhodocyclaceae bacterium]|nr:regulatory protein RecX [Rhodocyclaceae bacterium]